jgi:lipoprotein-anchoring transpeptidase ErfK/SrfK
MRRSIAGAGERALPRLAGSRSLVLVLALVVVVAAASGASAVGKSDEGKKKASTSAPVAHAIVPEVKVFDSPKAKTPTMTFSNPTPNGGELVFLVDALDTAGWAKVVLPVRPNGTTGWVHVRDVELKLNSYRIVVDLSDHLLTAFNGKQKLLETRAGIGKGNTPTPGGGYYITQLWEPPNPNGPYGPFAYSLSGFSEVLTSFQGGDAIIGIHGTNRPDLLGQDVSAGCIRISNDAITTLANQLPLGTPVRIKP